MLLSQPRYDRLARFAGNLAIGVDSAVSMPKALSMALRSLRGMATESRLNEPVRQVKRGATVADALDAAQGLFPPFVIASIRAGEETGRLGEALRFVERHCDMLAGPAKALRNTWFIPLCLFLAGDIVCISIAWTLGSAQEALSFAWGSLWGWARFTTLVGILLLPALRPWLDRARLAVPFLGRVERDIARHRFFRIMSLLWGVSGAPVDEVIKLAAGTVPNRAAREDLMRAATGIRRKMTVAEAFELPQTVLDQDEQNWIAGGELAGTLEETFDRLADTSAESLETQLRWFQAIATRMVMAVVALSILSVAMQFAMRFSTSG